MVCPARLDRADFAVVWRHSGHTRMLSRMIEGVGAQLRKGVAEFCILGLLDTVPMYGWELSTRLQEVGVIGSIGTLYPLLGRLRDRGSITAVVVPSAQGPARKYYSLTDLGKVELARFRAEWPSFVGQVNETIGRGTS